MDPVLLGRLSVLEFLVAQVYTAMLQNEADKDAFVAGTKQLIRARVARLPDECHPAALDAMERILESALTSADNPEGGPALRALK